MYELEQVFDDTAFVLSFILQVSILIIFLRMAWNVGKIRKYLIREDHKVLLDEAKKLEFKNKNSEAIDVYMDYVYYARMADLTSEDRSYRIATGVKAIKRLGGNIPKELERYL